MDLIASFSRSPESMAVQWWSLICWCITQGYLCLELCSL